MSDQIKEILSRPYSWVVVPDEDGRFSARISELPGCFSHGSSFSEALDNLREAAENWVASALSHNIAIPEPAPAPEASGRFALRMPKSLHAKLQGLAAEDGVSLNQFIVAVLSERTGFAKAKQVTKEFFALARQVLVATTSQDETSTPLRTFPSFRPSQRTVTTSPNPLWEN